MNDDSEVTPNTNMPSHCEHKNTTVKANSYRFIALHCSCSYTPPTDCFCHRHSNEISHHAITAEDFFNTNLIPLSFSHQISYLKISAFCDTGKLT